MLAQTRYTIKSHLMGELMVFEWLKFKLKNYQSPEDKLLDQMSRPMTHSQQREADQYRDIYNQRDNPNAPKAPKDLDDDFI
ncbi:MAG: hypothetical protein CMF46_02945 [Legionellales bacterium]|nr:hypothetical protein [Legionellales bacterium]